MVDLPGYSLSGAIATVFFITMTVKQPDNLRVTGPAHPVLARVKEDALLTCRLLSKRPTRHMEVRWYRSEPGTPIFVHQDGAEVTEMQMEEYGGRVEWIENGAAEGSVALRIHDIRPSDNGQYWCRFQDGNYWEEASLLLQVGETVSCVIHNPVLNEEKRSVISLPEKLQSELASLKVIGSSHPILVKVGEDTQLNCSLSPKANARGMEVRWVRSHRYPAVHVDVDGEPVAGEQMAEYRGRTTLVSDAIDEGRLTLQIRSATTSDAGQYRCLFEKDGVFQEASLDLKVVGLGSNPLITKEGLKDGKVDLMCTSDGWFPEPHVQWRDMEGKMIPPFSVALSQGRDGLFHVKTSLLVTDSSVVNVACAITNPLLNEEKNATFSVSGW
ncbi:butyrophilin-like protein 2 [Tupaia chinensis]|uniref:butyrophilin-like protein 2 n=1 Tax=Tupaia chinensis TaxID=246437 RepID=UPI0003C917CA|nr:butyrophilin-like protein 2 [Tupaia chinensis]